MEQINNTREIIEREKELVIGVRNAIEIEYEDRGCRKATLQQKILQKKHELNRLKSEHESLINMLASFELSQMGNDLKG